MNREDKKAEALKSTLFWLAALNIAWIVHIGLDRFNEHGTLYMITGFFAIGAIVMDVMFLFAWMSPKHR